MLIKETIIFNMVPFSVFLKLLWAYNGITAFTPVCRKKRLKGNLECKVMLLFV